MVIVPATAPPAAPETPIRNIWFFPDIDPAKAREVARIDNTVTPARLREALIAAIAHVNDQLRLWTQINIAAGFAELELLAAAEIDGESIKLHHYRRAVYSTAKASLIEKMADFDATGEGQKKAEEQRNLIDELRRDAQWALRDLQGLSRSTVELI